MGAGKQRRGTLSSVRREAQTPPLMWVAKEALIGCEHTALDSWGKDNVLTVLHKAYEYNRGEGKCQQTFREGKVATLTHTVLHGWLKEMRILYENRSWKNRPNKTFSRTTHTVLFHF